MDIDSTLTLIQHLFRDRSEIVLNYATLPEVQCFCELGQPGGHEPVTNADTGHGIEPEKLERVFDPGFTTKGVGVDVGLSIAYRIIEEHKGSIELQSEVGKGTTFTIRLPLSSPLG